MNATFGRIASTLLLCAAAAAAAPASASDRFRLELEGGAAWQLRNDFAVPGDTGTRLSIDDANAGPFAAFRGTLWWDLGERSSLRLLAAPFLQSPAIPGKPGPDFQTFAKYLGSRSHRMV